MEDNNRNLILAVVLSMLVVLVAPFVAHLALSCSRRLPVATSRSS